MVDRYCAVPGCYETAAPRGTMCSMHYKRSLRGVEMSPGKREQLTPWARVVTAAIELADADSEDDNDFQRCAARLRYAARRWVGSGRR